MKRSRLESPGIDIIFLQIYKSFPSLYLFTDHHLPNRISFFPRFAQACALLFGIRWVDQVSLGTVRWGSVIPVKDVKEEAIQMEEFTHSWEVLVFKQWIFQNL